VKNIFTSRILGLDFGEKRIGVSISDPLRITAQPLPTIIYKNDNQLWTILDQLFIEHEIEKIVIGLPLNMNGSFGMSSQKVESFSKKIKNRYKLEVELLDERLTSSVAETTMRELGIKPSKNKDKIDKLAAILILQNYLDKN
jgi:putative Holliday junction resolvase